MKNIIESSKYSQKSIGINDETEEIPDRNEFENRHGISQQNMRGSFSSHIKRHDRGFSSPTGRTIDKFMENATPELEIGENSSPLESQDDGDTSINTNTPFAEATPSLENDKEIKNSITQNLEKYQQIEPNSKQLSPKFSSQSPVKNTKSPIRRSKISSGKNRLSKYDSSGENNEHISADGEEHGSNSGTQSKSSNQLKGILEMVSLDEAGTLMDIASNLSKGVDSVSGLQTKLGEGLGIKFTPPTPEIEKKSDSNWKSPSNTLNQDQEHIESESKPSTESNHTASPPIDALEEKRESNSGAETQNKRRKMPMIGQPWKVFFKSKKSLSDGDNKSGTSMNFRISEVQDEKSPSLEESGSSKNIQPVIQDTHDHKKSSLLQVQKLSSKAPNSSKDSISGDIELSAASRSTSLGAIEKFRDNLAKPESSFLSSSSSANIRDSINSASSSRSSSRLLMVRGPDAEDSGGFKKIKEKIKNRLSRSNSTNVNSPHRSTDAIPSVVISSENLENFSNYSLPYSNFDPEKSSLSSRTSNKLSIGDNNDSKEKSALRQAFEMYESPVRMSSGSKSHHKKSVSDLVNIGALGSKSKRNGNATLNSTAIAGENTQLRKHSSGDMRQSSADDLYSDDLSNQLRLTSSDVPSDFGNYKKFQAHYIPKAAQYKNLPGDAALNFARFEKILSISKIASTRRKAENKCHWKRHLYYNSEDIRPNSEVFHRTKESGERPRIKVDNPQKLILMSCKVFSSFVTKELRKILENLQEYNESRHFNDDAKSAEINETPDSNESTHDIHKELNYDGPNGIDNWVDEAQTFLNQRYTSMLNSLKVGVQRIDGGGLSNDPQLSYDSQFIAEESSESNLDQLSNSNISSRSASPASSLSRSFSKSEPIVTIMEQISVKTMQSLGILGTLRKDGILSEIEQMLEGNNKDKKDEKRTFRNLLHDEDLNSWLGRLTIEIRRINTKNSSKGRIMNRNRTNPNVTELKDDQPKGPNLQMIPSSEKDNEKIDSTDTTGEEESIMSPQQFIQLYLSILPSSLSMNDAGYAILATGLRIVAYIAVFFTYLARGATLTYQTVRNSVGFKIPEEIAQLEENSRPKKEHYKDI